MPNAVDAAIAQSGDTSQIAARIAAIYGNRGVPIAFGGESEYDRLVRLTQTVQNDPGYFDRIRADAERRAAATAPPEPAKKPGPAEPPDDVLPPDTTPGNPRNALEYIRVTFPWLEQLGLTAKVQQWVVDGLNSDSIVQEVRNTAEHKARFAGMRRTDGSLRMNEAQYIQTEDQYRQLLKQFGRAVTEFDNPADYVAFFENELDPNELRERFETYDAIDRGGDEIRSAFYVYAGMELTTDDLYSAAVKPEAASQLINEYEERVALQPLDYDTWITRATEAGLSQVTRQLTRLRDSGTVGRTALSALERSDPSFARQIMAELAGPRPEGTQQLGLQELLHSFQYAMLGSAASGAGLELPGVERLEALRNAGVTRAKALEGYSEISKRKSQWGGMLSRANLESLDVEDYERALFLNSSREADLLERAMAQDKALQARTGSAAVSGVGRSSLIAQRGLAAV